MVTTESHRNEKQKNPKSFYAISPKRKLRKDRNLKQLEGKRNRHKHPKELQVVFSLK